MKKQAAVTAVLLAAALALVAAGVSLGEPAVVARKATNVCLECIGVG